MTSCNGTSQFYCKPAEGDTLSENQTVALEYNAQFKSVNGEDAVDVYLYHADNSSLAERILDIPNTGEMKFTVNSVLFFRGNTNYVDLVHPSTINNSSVILFSMVCSRAGEDFQSTFLKRDIWTYIFCSTYTSSNVSNLTLESAISNGASQTHSASHSSSGLSVGAIAGIVVCAIGVLAAFLVALAFFLKKNRDKVKLDSESDIPPPKDGEKAAFKLTQRRSLSTTDTTHFDVPLTFAPGSAPGTPRSTSETPRVPVEAATMYAGPPPRSTGQQNAMVYHRPPRSPNREMRQQYPTAAGQAPPSPKFPLQSNGVLPSGWQNAPAQRSQQSTSARDQSQPIEGQPRQMRTDQGHP